MTFARCALYAGVGLTLAVAWRSASPAVSAGVVWCWVWWFALRPAVRGVFGAIRRRHGGRVPGAGFAVAGFLAAWATLWLLGHGVFDAWLHPMPPRLGAGRVAELADRARILRSLRGGPAEGGAAEWSGESAGPAGP